MLPDASVALGHRGGPDVRRCFRQPHRFSINAQDGAHRSIIEHQTERSREDMWVILAALGGGDGLWVIAPSGLGRNPSHVLVT